jgi:hypothetical protein
MEREYEGRGLCPYDPDHNSTAVYSGMYTSSIMENTAVLILVCTGKFNLFDNL